MLSHSKTNVYAKAGLGLSSVKQSYPEVTSTHITVPLGLGLEHFVGEHFSVDLDARMGLQFTLVDDGSSSDTRELDLALRNWPVGAGLLWYY